MEKLRPSLKVTISTLLYKEQYYFIKKTSKENAIHSHHLNCNNTPSFKEFTILRYGNSKCVLKIKKSLPIKHERPILNENISSGKLLLFYNCQFLIVFLYSSIVYL